MFNVPTWQTTSTAVRIIEPLADERLALKLIIEISEITFVWQTQNLKPQTSNFEHQTSNFTFAHLYEWNG